MLTIEHVSTHWRRHDLRHVLCVLGHSRHVVVARSPGSHVERDDDQPHPGAKSAHAQMSEAVAQTDAAVILSGTCVSLCGATKAAPPIDAVRQDMFAQWHADAAGGHGQLFTAARCALACTSAGRCEQPQLKLNF